MSPLAMLRRLSRYPVMLAVLGLTLWAGRWGLAGLYAVPADRILEAWQADEKPLPPGDRSLETALEYLLRAISLDPGNAAHHYRMARLYHLRAADAPPGSEEIEKWRTMAEESYHRVVYLRPSWGHGWINLAQVQVQGGRISPETVQALLRGWRLAPGSLYVRKSFIRLGFALWQNLNGLEREEVLQEVERLLADHGEFVLKQADLYGRLREIRALSMPYPDLRKELDKLMLQRVVQDGDAG
ncbi:MAG: hypothetical protein HQL96_05040 [Magnetococcales bacterium]|nr:hypothetical protein [Magnetococcales bacterium]